MKDHSGSPGTGTFVGDLVRLASRAQAFAVLRELCDGERSAEQLAEVLESKPPSVHVLLVNMARSGLLTRRLGERPSGGRGRAPYLYSLPDAVTRWVEASERMAQEARSRE